MFGNLTLKRDEARDMWRFRSLDTFAQDVVVSRDSVETP